MSAISSSNSITSIDHAFKEVKEIKKLQIEWIFSDETRENTIDVKKIQRRIKKLNEYITKNISHPSLANEHKLLSQAYRLSYSKDLKKIMKKHKPTEQFIEEKNKAHFSIKKHLLNERYALHQQSFEIYTRIKSQPIPCSLFKRAFIPMGAFKVAPSKLRFKSFQTNLTSGEPGTLWVRIQILAWLKWLNTFTHSLSFEEELELKNTHEQDGGVPTFINNKKFTSFLESKDPNLSKILKGFKKNTKDEKLDSALISAIKYKLITNKSPWAIESNVKEIHTDELEKKINLLGNDELGNCFFTSNPDLFSELCLWRKNPTIDDLKRWLKSSSEYLQNLSQSCINTIVTNEKFETFLKASLENEFLASGLFSASQLRTLCFKANSSNANSYFDYLKKLDEKINDYTFLQIKTFSEFKERFEEIEKSPDEKSILGFKWDLEKARRRIHDKIAASSINLSSSSSNLNKLAENLNLIFAGVLLDDENSKRIFDDILTYFKKPSLTLKNTKMNAIAANWKEIAEFLEVKGISENKNPSSQTIPHLLTKKDIFDAIYNGNLEIALLISRNYQNSPVSRNLPTDLFHEVANYLKNDQNSFENQKLKLLTLVDFFVLLFDSPAGISTNPTDLQALIQLASEIKKLLPKYSLDTRQTEIDNIIENLDMRIRESLAFQAEKIELEKKTATQIFEAERSIQQSSSYNQASPLDPGPQKEEINSLIEIISRTKELSELTFKKDFFENSDASDLSHYLQTLFRIHFLKIKLSEFDTMNWVKTNAPLNAPNLSKYMKLLNSVYHYCLNLFLYTENKEELKKTTEKIPDAENKEKLKKTAEKILYAENKEKLKRTTEKIQNIILDCYQKDYHDLAFQLLLGLLHDQVELLHKKYNLKLSKKFDSILTLYDRSYNYRNYRKAIVDKIPMLPLMSFLQKDATFVHENTPSDGKIDTTTLLVIDRVKHLIEKSKYKIQEAAVGCSGDNLRKLEEELFCSLYSLHPMS